MESTSPVIDCEILRQMFSQHMCAGTLLNNVQCETKPSQGGLGVSNELLAVHFSHLQFEFINHFHNTSHLVEIAVDLVVQAFSSSYLCVSLTLNFWCSLYRSMVAILSYGLRTIWIT